MRCLFGSFRCKTISRKGDNNETLPVAPYPQKGIMKISTQEESLQYCIRQSNVERMSSQLKSLRQSLQKTLSQTQIISNNSQHHHAHIKQKLQFGTIEIREYKLILGDNPQCSEGVALTLDWNYRIDEDIPKTVDDYEYYRLPRRKLKDLIMPAEDREEILLRQGVTYDELNKAAEDLDKARLLRLQTINDFRVKSSGRGRKNLMSVQPWFHSSARQLSARNLLSFNSSRTMQV